MKKHISILTLSVVILCISPSVAQEDKLGTKVIDIVKSYTPTIAEAFKIRENAPSKDSVTIAKKKINYTIHSVPVASTFVPDKGKAIRMPSSSKKEKWYDSYVALGYGSLATLWADAYVVFPIDKESDIAFDLQHHSSENTIKGIDLASNFSNTFGQISYQYADKEYLFGASANAGHRLSHWFGVEDKSLISLAKDINIRQNYLNGGLKGYFQVNNSFFRRVDFSLQGITDDYDSSEFQLRLTPSIGFDFDSENSLTTIFDIDYLTSNFKQSFKTSQNIQNQNGLLGIRPTYHFLNDDFYAKIGLGAYFIQSKNDNSQVKIFPNIEINYNALGKELILFAGANGDIQQNTYTELSRINPFVSPTLLLKPTFTNYDIFAGIKGKIGGSLHYDAKLHYGQLQNLAMFQANPQSPLPEKAYQYDNSFGVIYDDAMVYGISTEIKGDLWNVLSLGASFKLNGFVTDNQKYAWNVPLFESTLLTDVQIVKNWFLGVDLFYIDARKDLQRTTLSVTEPEIVSLQGYFDANLHTDYSYKQWGISLNINNISSKNYLKWSNYPTQGLQILGALQYKF